MVRSRYVRWIEMEPQCARHCARGYRNNTDKKLTLTEFTVLMHDRYQRTLGTIEPNLVILMMKKLRTREEK